MPVLQAQKLGSGLPDISIVNNESLCLTSRGNKVGMLAQGRAAVQLARQGPKSRISRLVDQLVDTASVGETEGDGQCIRGVRAKPFVAESQL